MSNFAFFGAAGFVGLVQIYVCWFVERILRSRIDTVASGVIHGVAISNEHRRQTFWFSYFIWAWGAAAGQAIIAVCWWGAAKHAVDGDMRLAFYGGMWMTFMAMLAWIVQSVVWYRHFSSNLRQAEAD